MQRSITPGYVAGTGYVDSETGILGGVLFSVDGTNAGTLTIRKSDAQDTTTGEIIFRALTLKTPLWAPCQIEAAQRLYYVVAGTGAAVQIYEHVE